jgi:hypothetical protein
VAAALAAGIEKRLNVVLSRGVLTAGERDRVRARLAESAPAYRAGAIA